MQFLSPTAPSAPPSRPQVVTFSSNSITLSWESPPAEHVNGQLRHYSVFYHEQESGHNSSVHEDSATIHLTNLHPHFTYTFKVRAVTISPGPYSETQSIQLEEDGR